jgi:hypothetical protein
MDGKNIKTDTINKMGLINHAQTELQMLGLFDEKEDFYGGMTGKAVMELMEVFSNQEHSGMSAGIVADIFHKLANYEPLQPITGKDEEWGDITDYGDKDPFQQNIRESGLFKYADGKVTYCSAIIKRCPNGITWSGPLYLTREDAINDVNMIRSSQEIKGFPFTPKTFYIDVLEEETKPDDWIMYCKDPSQLDEVWEYYKKPEFL